MWWVRRPSLWRSTTRARLFFSPQQLPCQQHRHYIDLEQQPEIEQAFGSSIDTATVIPRQLQVVSRERAAKMYGVLPFYMANFGSSLLLQTPMQLLNAALVVQRVDTSEQRHFFGHTAPICALAAAAAAPLLATAQEGPR